MRWAAHVVGMEEKRGIYKVSVGKPEGKRPLGKPKRRWEDIIKVELQEVECGGMDWTEYAQDSAVTFECGNELSSSIKRGEIFDKLKTG